MAEELADSGSDLEALKDTFKSEPEQLFMDNDQQDEAANRTSPRPKAGQGFNETREIGAQWVASIGNPTNLSGGPNYHEVGTDTTSFKPKVNTQNLLCGNIPPSMATGGLTQRPDCPGQKEENLPMASNNNNSESMGPQHRLGIPEL